MSLFLSVITFSGCERDFVSMGVCGSKIEKDYVLEITVDSVVHTFTSANRELLNTILVRREHISRSAAQATPYKATSCFPLGRFLFAGQLPQLYDRSERMRPICRSGFHLGTCPSVESGSIGSELEITSRSGSTL